MNLDGLNYNNVLYVVQNSWRLIAGLFCVVILGRSFTSVLKVWRTTVASYKVGIEVIGSYRQADLLPGKSSLGQLPKAQVERWKTLDPAIPAHFRTLLNCHVESLMAHGFYHGVDFRPELRRIQTFLARRLRQAEELQIICRTLCFGALITFSGCFLILPLLQKSQFFAEGKLEVHLPILNLFGTGLAVVSLVGGYRWLRLIARNLFSPALEVYQLIGWLVWFVDPRLSHSVGSGGVRSGGVRSGGVRSGGVRSGDVRSGGGPSKLSCNRSAAMVDQLQSLYSNQRYRGVSTRPECQDLLLGWYRDQQSEQKIALRTFVNQLPLLQISVYGLPVLSLLAPTVVGLLQVLTD